MNASEMYGSRYLNSADIDGKAVSAQIESILAEPFEDKLRGKRDKVVVKLKDVRKPLVLNATNVGAMCDAWGPETDEWLHKWLLLGTEWTMVNGERKKGIRIQATAETEASLVEKKKGKR